MSGELLVFVGANATSDVPRIVRNFDRAILFEPLSWPCAQLRRMFRGKPNVEVVQAACGHTNKRVQFHRYNAGLSSSLATVTDQAAIKFPHADFTPSPPLFVRMIHLGKWLQRRGIERIHSLLVDAQGFDLTILKTMERWLPSISQVYTECDAEGFRHYNGPDNSLEAQADYLARFGFVPELQPNHVTWHPDVLWTRGEV